MFIKSYLWKKIYYYSIGSTISFLLIIFAIFEKQLMNKINIINGGDYQQHFLAGCIAFMNCVSLFVTTSITYISFFVFIALFIYVRAYQKRRKYLQWLFIFFTILLIVYVWMQYENIAPKINQISNLAFIFSFVFVVLLIAGLTSFSGFIAFSKKYDNIMFFQSLSVRCIVAFIFYIGILITGVFSRIIWGREVGENFTYFLVPNFKNYTLEGRFNSTFISVNVEYIGLLLYASFYFSQKYRWYDAVYRSIIIILMIVMSYVVIFDKSENITDAISAIGVVIFWYYFSEHIFNRMQKRAYGGSNYKYTKPKKHMSDDEKKAHKEDIRLKKENKKRLKKEFKKTKEEAKNIKKQNDKQKTDAEKEIDEILKKAAKEHKKKMKHNNNNNNNNNNKDDDHESGTLH